MLNGLGEAQKLSELIRYCVDNLKRHSDGDELSSLSVKNIFYQSGLKITPEVTPVLFNRIMRVCSNLSIPESAVEAFIYAAPDIQAECFAGSTTECVIRFTSSLIEILSDDEFAFVAGHELGHFLLCHSLANKENDNESIEYYIQQRSQEISADRIGLIACGSLDVAIRALMKTVSGLSSKHIRFDVGTFISQLKKSTPTQEYMNTSHPSILVRSRALLWFSLNDAFINGTNNYDPIIIKKIDMQIQKDMDKYVDGVARKIIEKAKTDLAMWMAVSEIISDGKFDKTEQIKFSNIFGSETLQKLINFLKDFSASEINEAVFKRMKAARDDLEKLIPSTFDTEYKKLNKWN